MAAMSEQRTFGSDYMQQREGRWISVRIGQQGADQILLAIPPSNVFTSKLSASNISGHFPGAAGRVSRFFQPSGMFVRMAAPELTANNDFAPALQAADSERWQRRACFQGKKNRHHGGTKRNTVTLAFIVVSRSRRPVLII